MATAKLIRARESYLSDLERIGVLTYFRPLDEYVGNGTPIRHQCTTCSWIVIRAPTQMKMGFKTCPVCLASGGSGVKITEDVLTARIKYHSWPYELVEFADTCMFRHTDCGRTFQRTVKDFLDPNRACACPHCPSYNIDGVPARIPAALAETGFEALEDYSSKGWKDKLKCRCQSCSKEYDKSVRTLIAGRGCTSCSKHVSDLSDRLSKHGYALVSRAGQTVVAKCNKHGEFKTSHPHILRLQTLCSKCRVESTGTSKVCTEWLEAMSNTFGLNIRHHSNGGEVSFGRMYRADGVCYENNTVYEFHGDIFHGNPEMFKPDDTPNYFHPNLTAKEMHDRTLAKEEFLRDLGWNYVHIWESEYRRQYNLHSTWKKFFKATLPSKKDQDAVLRVGTKPVYIRAFETPTAEDRNINLTALRTNMGGKKLHSKDDEITILWDGLEVDVTVEYSTNNYLEFWYWDETYKDYHLYCMRVS